MSTMKLLHPRDKCLKKAFDNYKQAFLGAAVFKTTTKSTDNFWLSVGQSTLLSCKLVYVSKETVVATL